MLVRKCDRCNVEIDSNDEYFQLLYDNKNVPSSRHVSRSADLCDTCYKIFLKFLHTFDYQEGAADNDE